MISKRIDYLDWDEHFMSLALHAAQKSKDPSTQVGACLVDSQKRVIGLGYNGFPRGCDDEKLPLAREGKFLETKYPYVVHAEPNAILNATRDTHGSKMYVTLYPCNECAKVIIQAGISEVIYLSDKYRENDSHKAAMTLFELSGTKTRKYVPSLDRIAHSHELVETEIKRASLEDKFKDQ
jgi:dCMP deaminase